MSADFAYRTPGVGGSGLVEVRVYQREASYYAGTPPHPCGSTTFVLPDVRLDLIRVPPTTPYVLRTRTFFGGTDPWTAASTPQFDTHTGTFGTGHEQHFYVRMWYRGPAGHVEVDNFGLTDNGAA
jgi:hypothetical protein